MKNAKIVCVTGIDTDIGKTIVTGLVARSFRNKGLSVITQKISQTGCTGMSEDIIKHRSIMGLEIQDVDRDGTTCPYVFPEPCSPHLAASLVGDSIDTSRVTDATNKLKQCYDLVLLEGVGGLLVPLNVEDTLLDYLEVQKYPLILVSSPRLGSINHTLSALELAKNRNIEVACIVYNRFLEENTTIADDSSRIFSHYLRKNGFEERVVDVYGIEEYADGKELDLNFLLK